MKLRTLNRRPIVMLHPVQALDARYVAEVQAQGCDVHVMGHVGASTPLAQWLASPPQPMRRDGTAADPEHYGVLRVESRY